MPASLAHFHQHIGMMGKKVDETAEAIPNTAKEVLINILNFVTSVVKELGEREQSRE
ncbi:hypothetical protein FKW77_004950 [Venturia effusa]|uniref:Uncharacterized protein n=1 Tax=Venturia effusa TaxID=50376 RepID=A0A517LFE9_9PEZI|nr:hypothetical protein FKW77_004950 [Venturia effusa]